MKLVREIGSGPGGRVEEVRLSDGLHVARKVFKPVPAPTSRNDYDKLLKRFQHAVRIQASLDAKGFVPIVEDGLRHHEPFYLMPLAENNLWQEIQSLKMFGDVPAAALADTLNALEELHELGYVHLNLKPTNVLFLDGQWQLVDFGQNIPGNQVMAGLADGGVTLASVRYCAPEVAIESYKATVTADIYAFGCILHDIYGDRPRTPFQQCAGPGKIGEIIKRCTDPRPKSRFQNIRELRSELLALLGVQLEARHSEMAADWVKALGEMVPWDRSRLEKFIRFLVHTADEGDSYAVLRQLNESALDKIHVIDTAHFKTLATIYCDWVRRTWFGWEFSDVIIRRLEKIFSLGDIGTKAEVVLAAAELAQGHKRGFVMGRLLKMCGVSMDDTVARRIAIEIHACDVKNAFLACAMAMHRSVNEYHPRIAKLLA